MDEYIDKNEAVDEGYLVDWYINSVAEYGDEKLNEPRWTEAHIEELTNDFIVIPKDTPAADVAQVVHARWEMKSEDTTPGIYHVKKAFCTRCGKSNKQYRPPYCPHCGAKMDGEV